MSIGARLNGRLTQLAAGRRLPRRTVRVRLTLLYGALFLLSGAALVATTYVLFERATAYTKPQLPRIPHTPAIRGLNLSTLTRFPPSPQAAVTPLTTALPQLTQIQRQLNQTYQLGLSVAKGRLIGPGLVQAVPQLAQDQRRLALSQRELAQAVNQLAGAVHQVSRAGSVEAAQRASDSHQLLVDSGIALGIVAVLALLAGWLLAGRMLRPIRTITRKARRISSTSLHERLALDGPQDELKDLADTLDDLLGRLDTAFEAQRQFVANASHELRTPLARQRALIQVALADPQASLATLRAAHERVLASEQHLEQMIEGLLTLTRGQAALERREQVELPVLVSQALLARESELSRLDLDVRQLLAAAPTTGDPRLLERLVANLVDNAIRHNSPGGRIELATGTRDRDAFLSIANTGETIPPEEIQRLFRPFQRLGTARTRHNDGNGLGLAIVEAIANAHDAELSAHPRPGGGLAIEVSFPLAVGVAPAAQAGQAVSR